MSVIVAPNSVQPESDVPLASLPQSLHGNTPTLRDEAVAVSLQHVTKSFARKRKHHLPFRAAEKSAETTVHALDDVSLEIRRNEIFGILGANGSGKSTLIRVISTLLIADEGSAAVFGFDVTRDEAQVKRLINRVSVEASFFKKLSPMENLLYAVRLYGRSGENMRDEITRLLVGLGIKAERVNAPLEQMSRGMQQKVAIARAFLTSPVLLLLDEPTTGLDPRSKKDVQRFVHALRDQHDATVVICTHDMDEAEALCDRLAIMDGGRVIASGTVESLKQIVRERDGVPNPSMEDVFIALTGRDLQEGTDEEIEAA